MWPEIVLYTRQAMQQTQQQFGEFLGVERNTVSRWERGVHVPVGRKARIIRLRYTAAKKNEGKDYGLEGSGTSG